MENKKRLCNLVNLEENSRECVLLTLKEGTSPLDLVRLGGFEGHECMFRMSKDPRTTCITVFRDGDEPYHMSYGSSNTLVGEDRKAVRRLVMECVNLDFGIYTHGGPESSFQSLVGETLGHRDLDSPRHFVLKRAPGYASLFVNDQHIANIDTEDLETWLIDRNTRLEVEHTEPGAVEVDTGYVLRTYAPELEHEDRGREDVSGFDGSIDKAVVAFLSKGGWRHLDAPSAVIEFAAFAKGRGISPDASLDDAMERAREKAAERNTSRSLRATGHKPPEHGL